MMLHQSFCVESCKSLWYVRLNCGITAASLSLMYVTAMLILSENPGVDDGLCKVTFPMAAENGPILLLQLMITFSLMSTMMLIGSCSCPMELSIAIGSTAKKL